MARRTQISFPTSYGYVTFLKRDGTSGTLSYRKKSVWKEVEEIGEDVRMLGLKLQRLAERNQSDKTGEKS